MDSDILSQSFSLFDLDRGTQIRHTTMSNPITQFVRVIPYVDLATVVYVPLRLFGTLEVSIPQAAKGAKFQPDPSDPYTPAICFPLSDIWNMGPVFSSTDVLFKAMLHICNHAFNYITPKRPILFLNCWYANSQHEPSWEYTLVRFNPAANSDQLKVQIASGKVFGQYLMKMYPLLDADLPSSHRHFEILAATCYKPWIDCRMPKALQILRTNVRNFDNLRTQEERRWSICTVLSLAPNISDTDLSDRVLTCLKEDQFDVESAFVRDVWRTMECDWLRKLFGDSVVIQMIIALTSSHMCESVSSLLDLLPVVVYNFVVSNGFSALGEYRLPVKHMSDTTLCFLIPLQLNAVLRAQFTDVPLFASKDTLRHSTNGPRLWLAVNWSYKQPYPQKSETLVQHTAKRPRTE